MILVPQPQLTKQDANQIAIEYLKKQKNNFRLNHLTFHGWKPIVSLESGINVVYNQIIRKSDFI
jgi:hypothetical protein